MGKFKESIHNPYIYDTEQGLPTWTDPVFIGKAMALRNDKQHQPNPVWEGRHGINEWTAWDVEGGYVRG